MITQTQPSLDIDRLEKVRRHAGKITARCPVCASAGGDKSGTHLVVLDSGKFGCAAFPGDREHRREIFALVGIKGERDPEIDREWRQRRMDEARRLFKRNSLAAAVRAQRSRIIDAHHWTPAEVLTNSPEQRLGAVQDPRAFLGALYRPDNTVWTGQVNQSGKHHADRWRSVTDWQAASSDTVGPMISPATWEAGTVSRSAENVGASPYTVLDFDGFDGIKPTTPEQLAKHIADSLAIVRWLREDREWDLAALIWTGSKSIHAWFATPSPAALESLTHCASALGVDAGLIGRAEHPCRLPGWAHSKTGNVSRVLWLAPMGHG